MKKLHLKEITEEYNKTYFAIERLHKLYCDSCIKCNPEIIQKELDKVFSQ